MQQDVNLWALPGVYDDEMDDMLLERWGLESVFQRVATKPVKEGEFWPVVVKT